MREFLQPCCAAFLRERERERETLNANMSSLSQPDNLETLANALFDLDIPTHVQLSPDGSRVIYSTSYPAGRREEGHDVSKL
jgi:hypothetical protein